MSRPAAATSRPTPADIILRPSTRRLGQPPPEVERAAEDPRNRLAHFVLVHEVARGGMGTVHRAWDKRLGRYVALKVLHARDATERLIHEALVAAQLKHPSIVPVYETGEDNGRTYLAMQFIEGAPLGKVERPLRNTLQLVRDAARALHYAHQQGFVHRDVKPGNILVDKDEHVYVTDFGLAREITEDMLPAGTEAGHVAGTPEYMSPEHVEGRTDKIDARSDVYSLGATLYAVLAGRPPFTGRRVPEILTAVVSWDAPPVSRFNPAVSPELQALVDKALSKKRDKRFATAEAFANAIDRLLREERYSGRFGFLPVVVRRGLPLAAAAVLAIWCVWLVAKTLQRSPAPSGPPTISTEQEHGLACAALSALESAWEELPLEERHQRLSEDVFYRLQRLLRDKPGNVPARVTKVRALLLEGSTTVAAAELRALAEHGDRDYRIPFLRAQLALDAALKEPPPLPAPEAPRPDWDEPARDWPVSIAIDLRGAAGTPADPQLADDHARDGPAASALLALAEGRWDAAADGLAELLTSRKSPLYARAWCRAAYMARRFDQVLASPRSAGLREHLGARVAMAMKSATSADELRALLAGADPHSAVLLHAALARMSVRAGRDPEPDVSGGVTRLSPSDRGELRGILLAARLQWLSLSGRDGDGLYDEALEMLGPSPSRWMAQIAAVELRLGRAARLQKRRADARQVLEDALTRADALAQHAPQWSLPRVLRGIAKLRLGQVDEAWAELAGCLSERDPRVLLAAAEVKLELSQQRRQAAQAWRDDVEHARELGLALTEHPEALKITAAAELVLARDAVARGEDESGFVDSAFDRLTLALRIAPNYVDARMYRAQAGFLRGECARRLGEDPMHAYQGALDDLTLLLADDPELARARLLRGVVYFALGNHREAIHDWRQAAQYEPRLNTPELQAWIRQAEAEAPK